VVGHVVHENKYKLAISVAEGRLSLKLTCSGAKLSLNDSFRFHIAALVLFIASSLTYRSLFAHPSSLSLCLILLSQGVHQPCCLALLLQGLRLPAPPFNNPCIYHQLTIGRARTAGIVQTMTRQTTPILSGNLNTFFFLRGYVLRRFYTQSLIIRLPSLDARRSSCSRTHPLHWPRPSFESSR
jgi:hypothetical protein